MDGVTLCVSNCDEWEDPLLGSFLKDGVHHGCAHAKAESPEDQAWDRHLQVKVGEDTDRDSSFERFKKANHRLLLGHTFLAGYFSEPLKQSGQAIVFEPLHQDISVVATEAEQSASPLKIAKVNGNPDHWLILFGAEHCLKAFFVRETNKAVNVLLVQTRRPKQFEKTSAKPLHGSPRNPLALFKRVLITKSGLQISQRN